MIKKTDLRTRKVEEQSFFSDNDMKNEEDEEEYREIGVLTKQDNGF